MQSKTLEGSKGEARIMSKGDVQQTIPSGDHILRTISEANITRPSVWNMRDKITITRSTMYYRY